MTGILPHSYTVELRITGKDLSPAEVTHVMGLEPTRVRHVGEWRSASSTFDKSVWSYTCSDVTEWDSLEIGLTRLMGELLPKKQLISDYASRFDVCWWCAHFQDSFDGGPIFSPRLLRDLADFGIALFLDNYSAAN